MPGTPQSLGTREPRPNRWWWRACLLLLLVVWILLPLQVNAGERIPEVWVFFRADIPLYAEIYRHLSQIGGTRWVPCPLNSINVSFLHSHPPDSMVVLGDVAMKRACATPWAVPILGTLITKPSDDPRIRLLDVKPPYLEASRELKRMFPGLREIWVPFISQGFFPPEDAIHAALQLGIALRPFPLEKRTQWKELLEKASNEHRGLFLPAEPSLFQEGGVQFLLRETLTRRIPLFCMNESLVGRGALGALVLRPARLAQALAQELPISRSTQEGMPRPEPRLFHDWDLVLNSTLLRKWGIPSDSSTATDTSHDRR